MSGTSLRDRVGAFLTEEAELADSHLFSEWLALWATDGIYWVPCNEDDYDPLRHVSIIYDDYNRLQERCFRLSMEGSHSQEPRSRLCRVMANPQLSEDDPVTAEVSVKSKMILVEVRHGVKSVYAARCEYVLQETGESFLIKRKKVTLLDNDEPLGNLTFIL